MFHRPCYVKLGDFVYSKKFETRIYGYVTWIDENSETGEYYVEVQHSDEADPLYFYDDQLVVMEMVHE
jgi:hypothetical protein